jgi:hypothetical protein
VSLSDSTASGNQAVATSTTGTATASGGGIGNFGVFTVRDTAVSNNTAQANGPRLDSFAGGGGIGNNVLVGDSTSTRLTLIDSTITHNSLMGSSGAQLQGGGLYNDSSGGAMATATNTVIGQNTPENCYPPSIIPGCSA